MKHLERASELLQFGGTDGSRQQDRIPEDSNLKEITETYAKLKSLEESWTRTNKDGKRNRELALLRGEIAEVEKKMKDYAQNTLKENKWQPQNMNRMEKEVDRLGEERVRRLKAKGALPADY